MSNNNLVGDKFSYTASRATKETKRIVEAMFITTLGIGSDQTVTVPLT